MSIFLSARRTLSLGMLAALSLAGTSQAETLWDVDFNSTPAGRIPAGPTVEELTAPTFPRKTYDALAWITRTRSLEVREAMGGLNDKPLVLSFTEDKPTPPDYGPQVIFKLPKEITATGRRYLLSLDVCKSNAAQAGGFSLGDVGLVTFREEGLVIANGSEIAKFEPEVPLHFDIVIDAADKTVTYTVDGQTDRAVTVPWVKPKGVFSGLRLDGYMPGGFARGRGEIAFDNIRLILESLL